MQPEDIIVEIKKFASTSSHAACESYDINDSDYTCGYFHGKHIAFGEIVDFINQLEKLEKKKQ